MKHLAIIGAGSWGTALSLALAERFDSIRLWVHDPRLAEDIDRTRQNSAYLPGFILPPTITAVNSLETAIVNADIIIFVVPSQFLRGVVRDSVPFLSEHATVVSATKGLEAGTLCRMSQTIADEIAARFQTHVAVLSGPTFAVEIARGEPAALVVASSDESVARNVQTAFSGPNFRLYTNDDPTGVELGGALKNVIAIGAGICEGLGLGGNVMAALVTRGLAEITRLAVALNGNARTLAGLAGLGDLVLTCTGDLSRNRKVGQELAKGRKLPDILTSTRTVAEGVETTFAAVELANRCRLELPITEQMYAVLKLGKEPRAAIRYLMERAPKAEHA